MKYRNICCPCNYQGDTSQSKAAIDKCAQERVAEFIYQLTRRHIRGKKERQVLVKKLILLKKRCIEIENKVSTSVGEIIDIQGNRIVKFVKYFLTKLVFPFSKTYFLH
ncbi:hypothetical protein C0J52_15557 [Blattella germanica]|nr:hypothetical protein C0J52_15557 [Blattella germanica]